MSVLIKGMEMPKSCWVCNFCRHYDEPNQGFFCLILEEKVDYESSSFYTKDNCPLVPVPPHGDLIDRDALMRKKIRSVQSGSGENFTSWTISAVSIENIRNAPTIIPADVPDNNVGNIPAEDGE